MATNNNWSEERQGRSIPLYLDKSALFYFNSFPEQTESNQRLLKQASRILASSSSYFRNCTHHTDWEIITTRQPLYNLISVTKYYSGDKTASFTDLNLM